MAYDTLLTHVAMDRGCEARLRMTADVARVLGCGEVIGLGAQAPWPFSDERDGTGPDFERLVQSARSDIAVSESAFRDALAAATATASWRSEIGYPSDVVAAHARAADLVLAYRSNEATVSFAYADPEIVLMEAGLPVLFMPASYAEFKADTVLFAWKNTREARRAAALALPVLSKARRVLVASVCHERDLAGVEQELADIARRLSRHGVAATTLAEVGAPGSAGSRLVRIAETDGSELIFAGAYGHSRLREWALGGVTRDLLSARDRFVLLCH
ncbi:universal stress protein [Phenylobacterium montanum]|uniref:Universal stress protein n=1 Tax=Phenylobacterium montanum TaxID=2823693 RepID=A0A975G073_9CAUL|nr:universal stress protein [Caulobacter sp. S6]QUD88723.1 universal stress protein [Caulobacter sp. S6]